MNEMSEREHLEIALLNLMEATDKLTSIRKFVEGIIARGDRSYGQSRVAGEAIRKMALVIQATLDGH